MDLLLNQGGNNLTQQQLIELTNTHPEFVTIRNYPGVMRIDLEYYGLINSPKKQPIFVVVANSDFTNRQHIPPYIQGVRVIVSYEEKVTVEQATDELEKTEEQEGEEGGEEGGEEDEEGGKEEEEDEQGGKEEMQE